MYRNRNCKKKNICYLALTQPKRRNPFKHAHRSQSGAQSWKQHISPCLLHSEGQCVELSPWYFAYSLGDRGFQIYPSLSLAGSLCKGLARRGASLWFFYLSVVCRTASQSFPVVSIQSEQTHWPRCKHSSKIGIIEAVWILTLPPSRPD